MDINYTNQVFVLNKRSKAFAKLQGKYYFLANQCDPFLIILFVIASSLVLKLRFVLQIPTRIWKHSESMFIILPLMTGRPF